MNYAKPSIGLLGWRMFIELSCRPLAFVCVVVSFFCFIFFWLRELHLADHSATSSR